MSEPEDIRPAPARGAASPLRWWPEALVLVLVAGYLALVHRDVDALQRALGFGKIPMHDFKTIFFPMGEVVLDRPVPVNGFLYSPAAALGFAAIAWLPYAAAAAIWAGFLLLTLLALARSTRWVLPDAPAWLHLVGFGLCVSSYPALHGLKFGQVSTPLCLALVIAFVAQARGRPRSAAASLSLAVVVKFYAAFWGLLFAFRRDLRAILWTAGISVVGLLLVPVVVLGLDATLDFYADVARQLDARFGSGVRDHNAQGVAAVLRRWGVAREAIPFLRWGGCAALAAWAFVLARRPGPGPLHGFVVLLCATPFLVPSAWPHYFAYLPFAQVVIWSALVGARKHVWWWLAQVATAGSVALSSMPGFDLVGNRHTFARAGLLLVADLLVLAGLAAARYSATFGKPAIDRATASRG
jgi:alpha-1,2-mannosyltransferase